MRIGKTIVILSLVLLVLEISLAAEQDTTAEVERYQIFFSPIARADAYLVDTKTGKVWTNIQYTDVQGQPRVWVYQEKIDSKEEFKQWLEQQKFIETKK